MSFIARKTNVYELPPREDVRQPATAKEAAQLQMDTVTGNTTYQNSAPSPSSPKITSTTTFTITPSRVQERQFVEAVSTTTREEEEAAAEEEDNIDGVRRPPLVTTTTVNTANAVASNLAINFRRPTTPTTPLAPLADSEDSNPPLAARADIEDNNPNRYAPALPSTSRQLFGETVARHGGNDSVALMQHEQRLVEQQQQLQQQQRLKSASSTLDAAASVSRNPSVAGRHEKKIGHRRVDEAGDVTYKRIKSKQIMGSIQLGIQHSVGSLASKPKRDLLMNDFWEMETISFPSDGSQITPAHHFTDFQIKVYAPIAFRYFRDLFGIAPDDFLLSMCKDPLRQLSNPGASGSLFYLTGDDEFIIKTVQKKEGEFLQKLLPGYYMNLSQNPRTLLPKFFGLWCFHYNSKNVRLVAMNNLLPSEVKMHEKYDLKGSTFGRKASKGERLKASPTYKDLDFMDRHPGGIFLEADTYKALMNTIQRDCTVLESFQIMDYSLLLGVHNLDLAARERREKRINNARAKLQKNDEIREMDDPPDFVQEQADPLLGGGGASAMGTASGLLSTAEYGLNRTRSMNRPRLVAHSTAMESITADVDAPLDENEDVPAGGIPARSENDERLIVFIGIIDILQSYRLEKKIEHTFKAILYNGDTVSVCRPSFYAQRFQQFMGKAVFKKTPTFPLKHSPSKRKTSTTTMQRTPLRTPSHSLSASNVRPVGPMTGSSTPPPAFDDISEEDLTATSSTATAAAAAMSRQSASANSRRYVQQNSYASSTQLRSRSRMSSTTDDYSDDDFSNSGSGVRSPHARSPPIASPRLTRTNVLVTAVGCAEEEDNGYSPTPQQRESVRTEQVHVLGGGGGANGKQAVTRDAAGGPYTTTLVVNDVAR